MNGGLYTQEQIDAHYKRAGKGTTAPLGILRLTVQFVSAFSPEVNAKPYRRVNRNVKKSGNRIYLEKWVDIVYASGQSQVAGELLERVAAIERGEDVPPIHTEVLPHSSTSEATSAARLGAEWVANITVWTTTRSCCTVGAATFQSRARWPDGC